MPGLFSHSWTEVPAFMAISGTKPPAASPTPATTMVPVAERAILPPPPPRAVMPGLFSHGWTEDPAFMATGGTEPAAASPTPASTGK
jgi:hypothetical protein